MCVRACVCVCDRVSEWGSLNRTSDRPVYLRLKEDVLLLTVCLTHFDHRDEAR